MSNYDREILIRNIKKLMDDNGITQVTLGGILGMSQSNVSKALSTTDKKNFTLDQLVGIANHFHTSIDILLGNRQAANRDVSPRAVAEYFVRLIEQGEIKVFTHSEEEMIYEPYFDFEGRGYDYKQYKKTVNYDAFFFPSYWHIPEGLEYEEERLLYDEITQCGNNTRHIHTNKFFHQFLQIYNLYKQKSLEEETYRTVVTDLLSHLRE